MNLSLKQRISTSFIIATAVILILIFLVFYFLDNLSRDFNNISDESSKISSLRGQTRISAGLFLKYQRRILSQDKVEREKTVEKINNLCEIFLSQLNRLGSFYEKGSEIKENVNKMTREIELIRVILGKASVHIRDRNDRGEGAVSISTIGDIADKVMDSYTELEDSLEEFNKQGYKEMNKVLDETKKLMMIILIIGFCAAILLTLVIPGKIALPFKKIKDAIRELQECNFDVSIYYNQDDEIGEIAREMNKMIHSFKIFDELRTDRILVENRKFDALANMVKKPILVANAEGRLIYMNNRLYSLLQVQSEDIIEKDMTDTCLPNSIIESFQLAIRRRSKIENAEIIIPLKKVENLEDAQMESVTSSDVNSDKEIIIEKEKVTQEVIFSGYANVIPIRGKDSSLDYYLMVMSVEIFS